MIVKCIYYIGIFVAFRFVYYYQTISKVYLFVANEAAVYSWWQVFNKRLSFMLFCFLTQSTYFQQLLSVNQ